MVLIVGRARRAGRTGSAPALAGAAVALVRRGRRSAFVLHRPLSAAARRSQLKYAVGVVLTSFGVFFLRPRASGVDWPGGDAALLYVAARRWRASSAAAGRGAARAGSAVAA